MEHDGGEDADDDVLSSKWVRVMADYCSDGFWAKSGVMASRSEMPISAALKLRHEGWCLIYEGNSTDGPCPFDMDAFSVEGLLIAQAIKAELPDWTVIYFDEAKCDLYSGQARSLFEYEVVPS